MAVSDPARVRPGWGGPFVFLITALGLFGCVGPADNALALSIEMRPLDLPEPLGRDRRVGEAELLGAWQLRSRAPGFGGFSALLVEGETFLALSDRAVLWRARIERGDDGTLNGLDGWRSVPVGDPARDDTEALARLADGALVIAVETPFALRALESRPPPNTGAFIAALGDLPRNRGVEALASLPDSGIVALAEGRETDGTHRVAILDPSGVAMRRYRTESGFDPTGADRLGRNLFVLERRLSLLGGFESRIVVLDAAAIPAARTPLVGREIARLGVAMISENFEGIAATREADGAVLLYVISDDNFSPVQRTLLLQLRWRDRSG